MLNGSGAGFDITWTNKIGKGATFAEFTLFIDYGFDIRIPWEMKVTVEPKLITQSPLTSALSVHTLDADSGYYVGAGLKPAELLDAQELVIEAGIGIAAKVKVLGATVLGRPMTNPLCRSRWPGR